MHNIPIDSIRLHTLHIGFCHHDGDWNWKNVRSPFARLYYVTEGTAQVIMPSGIKTLRPGYMYFIPAYTMHSDVCTSIFSHYYIHVYETPDCDISIFEELDFPFEVQGSPIDLELMKRLVAMNPQMHVPQSNPATYDNRESLLTNLCINKNRSLNEKMESRGTVYILMSRFLKLAERKEKIGDDRIQKIVNYIRHHINDVLDIGVLADRSFMSKDHFIRVFRQQVGLTPNAYIMHKKMERAELLLISSDIPIKQISHNLGYDDQSYFAKLFRKHAGLTPKQYRAVHQQ